MSIVRTTTISDNFRRSETHEVTHFVRSSNNG